MIFQYLSQKYQLHAICLGLAIILYLPVSLLLPDFTKYKVKLLSSEKNSEIEIITFSDLDCDGDPEKITLFNSSNNSLSILTESDNKILYQYNLTGNVVKHRNFFLTDDYNHDQRKEIFLLTYRNDSVFLHIIDGLSSEVILPERFLTKFKYYNEQPDFGVVTPQLSDLDDDGNEELILPFICAYTYVTRKIIIYHPESDLISISAVAGTSIHEELYFKDITGDNKKEIFGNLASHGNSSEYYPYSDHTCWLKVEGANAKELFEPINLGNYPGVINTRPFKSEEKDCIAVFFKHTGNKGDSCFIGLYNSDGELIKKHYVQYGRNLRNKTLFKHYPENNPTTLLLYREDGTLSIFDNKLNLVKTRETTPFQGFVTKNDIDGDGEQEYILFGKDRESLIITRNNFESPVIFGIGKKVGTGNIVISKLNDNLLAINMAGELIYLTYEKNSLFTYRYFLHFLFIFLITVILYTIGKLFQIQAKKKYSVETSLKQMQVQALENQLNPHFNLNILNSIGALYETHEKTKAQYYFGKYSKLLRQSLFHSGKLTISVFDEVEFVKDYLELEKLRLNKKFDYVVIGVYALPDIEIPKMLIHTFVENAVKHGLRHLNKNGKLEVIFRRENRNLNIVVLDNGIGREKAAKYSIVSTGKGLEIVNKSLDLYFETKNKQINYKIIDLYNHAGEAAGTKVDIDVPI